MQEILSEFCFKNIIIYIDDILIMTKTFEEHLTLVEKVLTTLMKNGIKIKVNKCEFFKEKLTFLGHIISTQGIEKSPEYIEKVQNFPKPTNVTQLRQFLGLVNFQRKFIDQCSIIAKPLTKLTGGPKRKTLTWTAEMENAFAKLKEKSIEEITLSFPDYSDTAQCIELYVDASGTGAGACLIQKQEGSYKTIAHASMTFSSAECRYSTIERELVAIRWGIKTFRAFLFGIKFILFTDHKPLLYLHNMAKQNSRLMRTIIELAEYDFTIKYRPGVQNEAADALSRINNKGPTEAEYAKLIENYSLPTGLSVMEKVDGGGDSLFVSLFLLLKDLQHEVRRI